MPDNTRREPHAAKEEAAKEEATKEEPAKEEPAKEEPAKEEPAKEEPAKEEPAKEEAAKGEAAKKVEDITPLVCTLLGQLTVKDDSPLHTVGITVPANGDQPEKFVTLSDLVREEYKTFADLQLLHEIAVNDEFKLTKVKNTDPLLETIARTMHNAFWDVMREELAQDPPQKERAINLLMDIRVTFRALLEGNNEGALQKIEQHLEPATVRAAIEQDLSAVERYTGFIIEVMGMACAAVRDPLVAKLATKTDLVDRLRGIMEVLELMRVDMANYVLEQARGELVKHAAEYEWAKFHQLFVKSHPIRCSVTEGWLRRAYRRYISVNPPLRKPRKNKETVADATEADATAAGPSSKYGDEPPLDVLAVMQFAYGELISPLCEIMIPEVFGFDVNRVMQLRIDILRLGVCAATVYITSQGEVPLAEEPRLELANRLMILVSDCSTVDAMRVLLESLWLEVRPLLSGRVTADQEVALKAEILKLASNRSQVYVYLESKITTYLKQAADSQDGFAAIPVPFKPLAIDLARLGQAYRKLIRHNRAVYMEFYRQIIDTLSNER